MTLSAFRAHAVWRSFREAVATMLAILLSFAVVSLIDAEPGPLVLAVVLTMSLSRSQLDRDWRGRLEAAVVLPLVGLMSLGVGALLLHLPPLGASVFVTGIAFSIWLRRFGPAAKRAGSLIALPFVVLLVTPYIPPQRLGHTLTLLMPIIVALIALASVTAVHAAGQQLKLLEASRKASMNSLPKRHPRQAAPCGPSPARAWRSRWRLH